MKSVPFCFFKPNFEDRLHILQGREILSSDPFANYPGGHWNKSMVLKEKDFKIVIKLYSAT